MQRVLLLRPIKMEEPSSVEKTHLCCRQILIKEMESLPPCLAAHSRKGAPTNMDQNAFAAAPAALVFEYLLQSPPILF